MKSFYKASLTFLTVLFLTATVFSQNYSNGIFILNEGMIGTETASISFIDENGSLENNIFASQNNGMSLGDTGQSIGFTEDYAYVVLNYSNEVKVIDRNTFELVTVITDQIENPRHIAFFEGYGYVTNWGDAGNTTDDYIAIIDLETHAITETIAVAEGPEEILEADGKLVVAHEGGYSFGNTISVIDTSTHEITIIEVGDVPSSIQVDDANLYVLCTGKPDWSGDETMGALYKVDLFDFQNISAFLFQQTEHPEFLSLDTTALFYVLDGNIYKMAKSANSLPTVPFIDTTADAVEIPYAFNKIDDKFYLGDAVDYVSNGKVLVYSEDGILETDYTVGQLPNSFYLTEAQTVSISDFEIADISLFPNPTSDVFSLNISENAELVIYDFAGRKIKTTTYNNTAVSITDLNAGMYLVAIHMAGKTFTGKLIVQ